MGRSVLVVLITPIDLDGISSRIGGKGPFSETRGTLVT